MRSCNSNKALTITAIGGNFIDDCAIRDEQQVCEALAEFARLAVAHEDRVAEMERDGAVIMNRRLHLASAFERVKLRAFRQVGLRQLFLSGRTRGDVAAAQAGVDMRRSAAHDFDGISGGGLIAKLAV